jgi:hypothetical protein
MTGVSSHWWSDYVIGCLLITIVVAVVISANHGLVQSSSGEMIAAALQQAPGELGGRWIAPSGTYTIEGRDNWIRGSGYSISFRSDMWFNQHFANYGATQLDRVARISYEPNGFVEHGRFGIWTVSFPDAHHLIVTPPLPLGPGEKTVEFLRDD